MERECDTRRRFLGSVAAAGVFGVTGCLQLPGRGSDIEDTDDDGVIDSEDYAPRDPDVQREEQVKGDGTTTGEGTTEAPPEVAGTVADGLGSDALFDVSNADDRGRLHVAYADGRRISYARVTTGGDVEVQTLVDEVSDPGWHLTVVAHPDGHANLLYDARRGKNRPQAVHRATIDPAGEVAATETLKQVDGKYWLYLFDALAVDDEVFAVVKESPDGREAWNTLWRLDARASGGSTRRLDVPSEWGVTDGIQLGRRGDRLYLGYAYGRKLTGPGTLGMNVYELGEGLSTVSKTKIESQGEGENWLLPSMTVHPSGRVLLAYARGPKGSYRDAGVVAYDPTSESVEETLYAAGNPSDDGWHADLLVTRGGSVLACLDGEYRTFSGGFASLETTAIDLRRAEAGLNGAGQPGLVGRTASGELRYRSIVVEGN